MKKIITMSIAVSILFVGKLMAQSAPFNITGTFGQSANASKVYLVYQYEGEKYIDSAAVINRQFQVKGNMMGEIPATLVMDHRDVGFKRLLKTPVDEIDALKFYLYPGNTSLTLKDSVSTAVFTNSKD